MAFPFDQTYKRLSEEDPRGAITRVNSTWNANMWIRSTVSRWLGKRSSCTLKHSLTTAPTGVSHSWTTPSASQLQEEILRDSPMWQEIENDARAEGPAKGRADADRRALTQILTRRFGAIPVPLDARIANASVETLDRWIDQALIADSVEASLD